MSPQLDAAAALLNAQYGDASADTVLSVALEMFAGRVALVSSFGAEAAVLLHMLSKIDTRVPVLMIDTELLFPETLAYQTEIACAFGLTDVRRIKPVNPEADLHLRDTMACCEQRKVRPLNRALLEFDVVVTGRKRFQTGLRTEMEHFEVVDGRLKVNPLATWTPPLIAAYFDAHTLPRHPLVARGYPSIGCAPCTSPVGEGESARSGRWRDEEREECGIHFNADGTIERRA